MSPEVVNFSDWCDFFAFDVMGDLGFSEDFGMLRKGKASLGTREARYLLMTN